MCLQVERHDAQAFTQEYVGMLLNGSKLCEPVRLKFTSEICGYTATDPREFIEHEMLATKSVESYDLGQFRNSGELRIGVP